jgi:hypothetical protein
MESLFALLLCLVPQEKVRYSGTVLLAASEEAPATTQDGTILVAIWPRYASYPDRSPERMPVPPFDVAAKIADGKFEFLADPDSVFIVHRLELGGRAHHVLDNRPTAVKLGEEWKVRADTRLVRSVHVIAGEDRSDLKQAFAVRADKYGWNPDPFTTRGPDPINSPTPPSDGGRARVVWDAPARFELAFLDDGTTSSSVGHCWFRAPHRKWRRVTIDFAEKKELEIALDQAAVLVVDLIHAPADTWNYIGVYPGSAYATVDEWRSAPERQSVIGGALTGLIHDEFDPLPAGEYVVIAEVSDKHSKHAVLGRVTLVDGKVCKLELDVKRPP